MPDQSPWRRPLLAALRKEVRSMRRVYEQEGVGHAGWLALFAPVVLARVCAEYPPSGYESPHARFLRRVEGYLVWLQLAVEPRKRAT